LVAAAQAGDPDSVDQLCRVLWGPVYSTAASALKRADLAEDCAQDTLYIISRRLRALDTSRNIVGFARRIALHEAHRIWKRWMRPLPEVDDQLPSCDPSPFEVAAREEMLELLRVAGDKLLPKYRAVFQLRVAGAPIADIAQALGISNLGTVRCILSRAYQMLRNHSSLARAVA
jgi:RNA polymerase sigma factor (sigma-70 family)